MPPKASELGEAPLGGSGIKDTEDGRANRPNVQIYTFSALFLSFLISFECLTKTKTNTKVKTKTKTQNTGGP